MSDNITLPRELVEKAIKAFENGCPPTCENGMIDSGGFHPWGEPMLDLCPACLAFKRLRTRLAAPEPTHPGYVIGSHWLETAYSRIAAGEAEADVLVEVLGARGWVQPPAKPKPATHEQVNESYKEKGIYGKFSYFDYKTGWHEAEQFHGIRKENKT
jgi:hypothetical protein